MSTMRAMQVRTPGKLELVELPIPEPGAGEVRIHVRACGICHSDVLTVLKALPGIELPRSPGHEIAGVVDSVGAGVTTASPGDRVGVGWYGGNDGTCPRCLRGDFLTCRNLRIPGISYDGGYSEYVIAPANVLAPIPDALSFEDAAPLMCAGLTTYNALRHSGARPGDLVAIQGLGGLGHLGVRYARAMGFDTVAIARGRDKEKFALELGASSYIDSQTEDVAAALTARGGATVVLSTVTSGAAMTAALGGLAVDGKMIAVGASTEPIEFVSAPMIGKRATVQAWPSGTAADSADTLRFSVLTGVRPMIETMPLERAMEAYERMMSGAARFRMVLTTR
ncbi:MAG: Alcohol dehydrogenase GroES domain protein [Candidatus Eremiobacteraeota bacterium]|nr:Alcohol dehydrogenase GroES domain protein [Candidatus Eremiobacteraeota bacterium]